MSAVLENHTALVTGGAKRLGKAIACELAAAGSNVVIHYNTSQDEALETCNAIESLGVRAIPVQGSLSNPDDMADLFEHATSAAGEITILANSAASFPSASLMEAAPADFEEVSRLNALSPLFLCREFAAQNIPGSIVNLLDARIVDYDKTHVPYHIAKRSLADMTMMLSIELAPDIRVNGIAPGLVLPPEGETQGYLKNLAHTNPLQTFGCAEDVARTALFLATSDFITGQIIYVDGGRHLNGSFYGH